jgi:hypothetical protein
MNAHDPVLARRAVIARWNRLAQRIGYGAYAVSCIAFGVGVAADDPSLPHGISGATLIIGSIILAPAIVIGYGIKAADRHDRELAAQSRNDNPR